MKKLSLIIVLLSLSIISFAQVAINSDGANPDASAMLDISSSNKGILIPRMADHTDVISPVKGVLVFNTSTNTFWFYNGSAWTEIAAGGGGGCTLDQAYDFGGAGNGRIITASDGAIEFNNGANTAQFINATNIANFTNGSDIVSLVGTGNSVVNITTSDKESALTITNSKTLSYGINVTNTGTGNTIIAENSNTSNIYNAIEGVSRYGSTSSGNYPSGVAGYFDGNGMGVGVWGQSDGNGSSTGAGVYGMANNQNYGGWLHGNDFPGLNCKTNSNYYSAQITASGSQGGTAYNNPGIRAEGYSKFVCSNSGATSIYLNNQIGEPSIIPASNGFGEVGDINIAWWKVCTYDLYYQNAYVFKKNVNKLNKATYELVMEDIDLINPEFFNYKVETDNFNIGGRAKYKANLRLGVKLEEMPAYLMNNSYSMTDLPALTTLTLVGVKYNRAEIKELKQNISTFGIIKMQSNSTWVNFDNNFSSKLSNEEIPTVTLTTNSPNANVYISEQNNLGFRIAVTENSEDLMINWIAMAKVKNIPKENKNQINPELYKQIRVPEVKKKQIKELFKNSNKIKDSEFAGNGEAQTQTQTRLNK